MNLKPLETGDKPLEMKVELTVVEDLGIKLYGKLPPVVSEMVANAWDADAISVQICFDEGIIGMDTSITVTDDGRGMSYEDIANNYLRVGRKRREEEKTDVSEQGRRVMGRKGIGKLSVFGIAERAEIQTIRDGKQSVFLIDVNDMLKDASERGVYNPPTLMADEPTDEKSGTTVKLTRLKRKTPMDAQSVRRGVARNFSVIGDSFRVSVNGEEINPSDKIDRSKLEMEWPIDANVNHGIPEWRVLGWIGATEDPLDEDDRGIVITARGKLIEKPTTFEVKSGEKFSYSYITGEISAEFFDDDVDFISTNRQSILWDTPQGEALKEWGSRKIRLVSEELAASKREKKEKTIRKNPEISSWLISLTKPEQKRADRIIKIITSDDKMSDQRRVQLMRFTMSSFEHKAFLELEQSLGDHPNPADLLSMFEEWNVVEAREMAIVVAGRLKAIKRLNDLIKTQAKEVPDLHNFFKKFPWVLEPTWTQWQDEVHYSDLLRERFPDARLTEPNRRIDFLAIGVGDTVHVVELKRPGYRVKSKDLVQLNKYVGFVRELIGNEPERSYKDIAGHLLVGSRSRDSGIEEMVRSAELTRKYLVTYNDLLVTAGRLHEEFEKKLAQFEQSRNVAE